MLTLVGGCQLIVYFLQINFALFMPEAEIPSEHTDSRDTG